MAAKRITQSHINWTALSERVPEHQRVLFTAFKTKSDNYLRKMLALPEKSPTIDWAYYKVKVPVAGMVDDFQKQFEALTIPYPPNTVTGQIEALEKEITMDIMKFKTESNTRIEAYKKELAHILAMIPFDQMTMEDFRDAYPDQALDPINRPTFWPHTPEDQLGYEDDKDEAPKAH